MLVLCYVKLNCTLFQDVSAKVTLHSSNINNHSTSSVLSLQAWNKIAEAWSELFISEDDNISSINSYGKGNKTFHCLNHVVAKYTAMCPAALCPSSLALGKKSCHTGASELWQKLASSLLLSALSPFPQGCPRGIAPPPFCSPSILALGASCEAKDPPWSGRRDKKPFLHLEDSRACWEFPLRYSRSREPHWGLEGFGFFNLKSCFASVLAIEETFNYPHQRVCSCSFNK